MLESFFTQFKDTLLTKLMPLVLPIVLMLSGTSYESLDYSDKLGSDYTGLAEVYEEYFPIGSAVYSYEFGDVRLIDHLEKNFNSITPEWELKQVSLNPSEGVWNYDGMDVLANYCRENNYKLRGHTLMWSVSSTWMAYADGIKREGAEEFDKNAYASKEVLFERMEVFISAVMARYGDIIDDWDVVNEPSHYYNDNTYHPNSVWYQIAGEEYISKAFELAEKYGDENDKFFVNETKVLNNKTKENNLFKVVDMLRSKGLKVDGIGVQCHLDTISFAENQWNLKKLIDRARKAGLEVQITEMDMRVYTSPDQPGYETVPEWIEIWQINKYKRFFDIFRENSDIITNVTFWGLDDAHSVCVRPDRDDWALLFDKESNPKQAFFAVCDF